MPPPGEHESFSKQIKRASEAMHNARVAAMGKQLEQLPTVTEELGRATAEILAKDPPITVSVVNDQGQIVPPLIDNQGVTEAESFKNLNEARRAMQNYRDAAERGQQQLLADLQAQEQAQRREAEQFDRLQREQQAAAQRPAPQPQPDPLAAEKAHLAQQQQNLYWQQLSEGERAAAHEMRQIEQWVAQAKGDERAQALGYAEQRYDELRSYAQQASALRTASQTNAANARQQQINAWGQQQDALAQQKIKADMPEYADDAGWRKLQQATLRALKSTGLTQEQIDREWAAGRWRASEEQVLLSRLGREQLLREAKQRLNEHKRVPPVQQPGMYRAAGAGAMDEVRSLERQLDGATGQRALQIARQLTQARREAGLLRNER
jgi:hypothetical protein